MTDEQPVPNLPRVDSFVLLDASDRGRAPTARLASTPPALSADGHDVAGQRHQFLSENESYAFPGGAWSLAGDGSDPYAGVYSDAQGLVFSTPLGDVYEGEWVSREQLLVRVHALPGGTTAMGDALAPLSTDELSVRTRVGARTTPSAVLTTYMRETTPPRLVASSPTTPTPPTTCTRAPTR